MRQSRTATGSVLAVVLGLLIANQPTLAQQTAPAAPANRGVGARISRNMPAPASPAPTTPDAPPPGAPAGPTGVPVAPPTTSNPPAATPAPTSGSATSGVPALPPPPSAPLGAPPSNAPPPANPTTGAAVARVTKGSGSLPNQHGQIWREYDISPFTTRQKSVEKPERILVDWILRETGSDVWFSEPLGILNADKNTLRVYHTPEMQRLIAGLVDRFVHTANEGLVVGVRLATVGSPNWRSRAYGWMRPVDVKSPGIEAWLISKENAAFLLADLTKRADYREHNSPNVMIANGQSHTMSRLRPKSYVKGVRARDTVVAGYDSDMGQIDEGYSLEISPLFALDSRSVDAVIKCQIEQVEKMVPVTLDLPGFGGQWQRAQIQVPQVVSWRLNERFRWPTDQVLLLSCGVVASPAGEGGGGPLAFVNALTANQTSRAEALLFLECHTRAPGTTTEEPRASANPGTTYRGRY